MTEVNENLLKITGEASIPQPLSLDTDYSVALKISIVSTTQRSQQDGSFDNVFKGRILSGEVINEEGKSLKIKDRNSNSKKLRNLIYRDWLEAGTQMDDQIYYDVAMNKLLANWEDVRGFLRNK